MQPLFEHRLELAGYGTRALELRARARRCCSCTASPTAPTPGGCCSTGSAARAARALALDLPGLRHGRPARPDEPILPQLDALRDAALECTPATARVAVRQLARRLRRPAAGRARTSSAGRGRAGGARRARHGALVRAHRARPAPAASCSPRPLPVPDACSGAVVAEVYSASPSTGPAHVDPRVAAAFAGHFADRATPRGCWRTGRRLLPELRRPLPARARSAARCCWSGGART